MVEACVKRGDELIGHGHTNSDRQGELSEADERALLDGVQRTDSKESKARQPRAGSVPWISESLVTPDLLAETGYRYTLNWCHDDQPVRVRDALGQRSGRSPTRRS